MTDYDLDLDLIQPETKRVKIDGQIVDIYPPHLNELLKLMTVGRSGDAEVLREALLPVVPALADGKINPTFEQIAALIEFAIKMSMPTDKSVLEKHGYTLSGEKKSPPQSNS